MKKSVCKRCTEDGGYVWSSGSEEAWDRGRVFCRFAAANWIQYFGEKKRPPNCCQRKEAHLGKTGSEKPTLVSV